MRPPIFLFSMPCAELAAAVAVEGELDVKEVVLDEDTDGDGVRILELIDPLTRAMCTVLVYDEDDGTCELQFGRVDEQIKTLRRIFTGVGGVETYPKQVSEMVSMSWSESRRWRRYCKKFCLEEPVPSIF